MSDRTLKFRREVIDADPPGADHDVVLLGDVNGNGRNDIVIGCKTGDVNLFWYESPSWRRHEMASAPNLEAGGVLTDVDGDGRLDVVVGQQIGGRQLLWFACPEDPTARWPHYVIEDRFEKYHDQAVGDVDGDGKPEIVALSQAGGVLFYYDIPTEPRTSRWPRECFHLVDGEIAKTVEGLAVVDLDGDGRNEIIAGPGIYHRGADGSWRKEPYAADFVAARVKVADLDGDGQLDIVICEAERTPARLAICSPPEWEPRVLRNDLFHGHSLEIADFDGDGRPDIFVGEMSLGRNPEPKLLVYLNQGGCEFEEVVVWRGVGTHEAKVADMTGDGRPDIVGKPYQPKGSVDIWLNETA